MKGIQTTMRRFITPTCTLEITGEESALSRWMGEPLLKQLRFRLWFVNPDHPDDQRVALQGDRAQLDALQVKVETYVQALLADETYLASRLVPTVGFSETPTVETGPIAGENILLRPRGILSHELVPGALAVSTTQPPIRLSFLELSDLTTVLDRYATELRALPNLNQRQQRGMPEVWWQMAALALVTVGMTGVVTRLILPTQPLLQTATSPPATPLQEPIPVTIVPEQRKPSTAIVSTPIATNPSAGVQVKGQLGSKSAKVEGPADLFPRVTVPANPVPAPARTTAPQIALNPGPQTTIVPESRLDLPPLKQSQAATNQKIAPGARPATIAVAPVSPSEQFGAQDQLSQRPVGEVEGLARSTQPAPASAPSSALSNQSGQRRFDSSSTAFDVVPQVAEARAYLQQRWQPPTGLTNILEYSVVIAEDGKLQRIIPLNQSAINYINQTGLPVPGQLWLSPLQGKNSLMIRVVLSPEGTVQTFME